MYAINHINRGKQVIEWRHMPSAKTNTVLTIFKKILTKEIILHVLVGTSFAWAIVINI